MPISDDKANLLIIDANGLAHRCMYAYRELGFKNEDTFIPTGLPYGFITNLIHLNKHLNPDYMIIVWDGGSHRRIKLYPAYKQKRRENRIKEKEEAKKTGKIVRNYLEEVLTLHEIMKHLGIQQFQTRQEEADDLIGTLIYKLHQKYKITIASNDHDFMQLLQYDDVNLYKAYWKNKQMIHEIYDRKKFIKEYGFNPKYYINVLAIGGDRTDEYPGVPGISEQSAIGLVREYGKFDNILTQAESGNMKERLGNLIIKHKDLALLCRKLARIRTDVELNEKKSIYDEKIIKERFKNLRFHSLLFEDKFQNIIDLPKRHLKI